MNDNKFVDEHRLMCMESQLMSNSVCPTNVIGCTNTYKKYFSIQQTESHKGIHNDEKVHNCSTCDKCFPLKSHLNVHPPKHTSEKSFTCSSCDKCFTWKGDLKKHQRIHTGENVYSCSTCEKCFTHMGHLEEHQRVHTGDKPYRCTTCDKCFTLKCHLDKCFSNYLHVAYRQVFPKCARDR